MAKRELSGGVPSVMSIAQVPLEVTYNLCRIPSLFPSNVFSSIHVVVT